MTITQALSLDVARESVVRISAKQFDENSRFLLVTVLESGQEQSIPSASTITLNGRRPDGSSQSFLGSVQDGKALVEIDSYLLEQYGTVYCSVSIIGSDGSKLSTLSFRMVVERAETTGWVLMYTAPSALSAGTYHINVGSISYQFTLTQALPVGGCIYFSSDYTGAKTVVNGADVETLTLTVGTSGTELIGSDVVNFLSQISAEVSAINEGLESKADKSAIEENLTAGTSLATIDKNSYTPSTSPYLHRISPSGKRCEYDVIGGTVGWNQYCQEYPTTTNSGITLTNDGNGKLTASGTSSAGGNHYFINYNLNKLCYQNHKYYVTIGDLSASRGAVVNFRNRTTSTNYVNVNIYSSHPQHTICNATEDGVISYYLNFQNADTTITGTICPMVIDLTTLLGSTIADYAYTLEQATAGSGIAWLKSFGFLSKRYYPYCEPTLESVQATERKAVGINQWDEEWEKCIWNEGQNGVKQPSELGFGCKDYISALPSTTYCLSRGVLSHFYVLYYDADHAYLGHYRTNTNTQNTFTTPDGCHYITFYSYNSYGTTYKNNICINISNPTINGTYYPYEPHTYPLGNVTLRGVLKLDSSNNIYYDGDKYGADGTVTRRFGVVDLGTLTWYYNISSLGAFTSTTLASLVAGGNRIICSKYSLLGVALSTPSIQSNDKFVRINKSGNSAETGNFAVGTLIIKDTSYTDAATFKTAMSGVYLYYELATPTTESTDPFTPIQYTGSTESFTTENDVPVGVDAKYYTDLTLPKLPTANGTYTLKCTVTDGTGIVSWVSE